MNNDNYYSMSNMEPSSDLDDVIEPYIFTFLLSVLAHHHNFLLKVQKSQPVGKQKKKKSLTPPL